MSATLSPRLLTQQTGVISAFLLGATRSLLPLRSVANTALVTKTVTAPSLALQQVYADWSRATPGRYDGSIPPHMVNCQIALPMISALTARAPYPLLGVLNQGIRLQLHHPLPAQEKIILRGHLVDASDDGYRARIHSRIEVGCASHARAMTLDAFAAVVLKKRSDAGSTAREKTKFTTISHWQAAEDEGRKFFYLTGDFNPIHTWPAFARRTRFRGCIMHGYGAFAQIFEAVQNAGWVLSEIETKFIKPLPLPSPEVLIQVAEKADSSGRYALRLTDAAGNLYQVGSFLPKGERLS